MRGVEVVVVGWKIEAGKSGVGWGAGVGVYGNGKFAGKNNKPASCSSGRLSGSI